MIDLFKIAREASRGVPSYQSFVSRYKSKSNEEFPRWPIFRYYSMEHFIGKDTDFVKLSEIDRGTYEILAEDRSILDRIGFNVAISEVNLISTNMGSRLVVADPQLKKIASIDFHGKSNCFSGFDSFFRAEISLEVDFARSEPFIASLAEQFDPAAINLLGFG
jgi:hypothetical protein